MSGDKKEIAVFGGGCFWCTEAIFAELKGVMEVIPGYSGGRKGDPSYEEVSLGNSGYIEVIKIIFDPAQISFEDLLAVFFATHDPTAMDRQGNDAGPQYRSVIFYINDRQKKIADEVIKESNEKNVYGKPIVTSILPLKNFYAAEEYHKEYYKRNTDVPYCQLIIEPKLEKMKNRFNELLKTP